MMEKERKKVLVGPALFNWSETQRMITLADGLYSDGWEVYLVGEGMYDRLLAGKPYHRIHLPCDSWWYDAAHVGRMMEMGHYGGRLGTKEELAEVIAEEVKLIDSLHPDLMLTGYRMTFCASARIRRVPLVYCMSAVMSEMYLQKLYEDTKKELLAGTPGYSGKSGDVPGVLRECQLEDSYACGRLLGQSISTLREWNEILAAYKADRMEKDLCLYTGDLTLMADAEEFFPDLQLGIGYRFIGPILNYEDYEVPDLDPAEKNILISVGSSCSREVLKVLLEAAEELEGYEFYVTTAGMLSAEEQRNYPDRFHFYEKLALTETARGCRAAVIHGGQGTIYNVLKAGCPVAAFPQTFEQRHNIQHLLQVYPCGKLLCPGELTASAARRIIKETAEDPHVRREAGKAAGMIGYYEKEGNRTPENAVKEIGRFLQERRIGG